MPVIVPIHANWANTVNSIGDAVYEQFGVDGTINDAPARLLFWQEQDYISDGVAVAIDRNWRLAVRLAEIPALKRNDVVQVEGKTYRIDAIDTTNDGFEQQAWIREVKS